MMQLNTQKPLKSKIIDLPLCQVDLVIFRWIHGVKSSKSIYTLIVILLPLNNAQNQILFDNDWKFHKKLKAATSV